MGDKRLLTGKQVAEETGLSIPTVLKAIRDGQLPSIQISQRRYVSAASLDRFLVGLGEQKANN